MVRTFCDGCGKDTFSDPELWGLQMAEMKKQETNYLFHFCDKCKKEVFKAVESSVRGLMEKSGNSQLRKNSGADS